MVCRERERVYAVPIYDRLRVRNPAVFIRGLQGKHHDLVIRWCEIWSGQDRTGRPRAGSGGMQP